MSFLRTEGDDSEQWAPVADLMAALMLIFMFIAVIFIRTVADAEATHDEECEKIEDALRTEFRDDFDKWGVCLECLEDLTIRFYNPTVSFKVGDATIQPRFEGILTDFFPRYMKIVRAEEFEEDIREIRIEGHTSSEYGEHKGRDAYFLNMDLSQRRTRAILRYVLELEEASEYEEWARPRITANGLSSSQPILKENGKEDEGRSRRVEFRLLTASCQKAGRYENKEVAADEN